MPAARIPDLFAKGQNLDTPFRTERSRERAALLADMPPAVVASEPGAGSAGKAVAPGLSVAADRAADDGGRRMAIAAAVLTTADARIAVAARTADGVTG